MTSQAPQRPFDLSGIDLNLLIALGAILRSSSMSEVRRDAKLSPRSAASALARLREHFDDELIVTAQRGFELTPFAQRIRPKVDIALASIDDMLKLGMPSPERFVMAMPDFHALVLTSQVAAHLREVAPGCAFHPAIGLFDALAKLERGQVDLVLGNVEDAPVGFFRRALPGTPTMCLCRKGHPGTVAAVPFDELARFTAIRIDASDQNNLGDVDDGLDQLLPRGSRKLTVPDIHTAAVLLAETDAILALPAGPANCLMERYGLDAFAPDPETSPEYRVSMIWHERSHRDEFHSSVRNVLPSFLLGNARPLPRS